MNEVLQEDVRILQLLQDGRLERNVVVRTLDVEKRRNRLANERPRLRRQLLNHVLRNLVPLALLPVYKLPPEQLLKLQLRLLCLRQQQRLLLRTHLLKLLIQVTLLGNVNRTLICCFNCLIILAVMKHIKVETIMKHTMKTNFVLHL